MLFKTDNELLNYLTGVNTSFKLSAMISQIKDVELRFIKPLLGATLYEDFQTRYNADPQNLTEYQAAILPLIQNAIAHLAFVEHIPFMNVDASPGGLRVSVNENRVAASQFRTEDLKKQAAKQGWNALEELILYLYKNSENYDGWSISQYYQFFINDSRDFSEFHDIGCQFQVFWKLRPNIRIVEQQVKAVIGKDLFDEIKEQILDDDISAENALLMPFIKLAIAKLSVVKAISSMSVDISEIGISENTISGFGDNFVQKTPARDNVISYFLRENKEVGENALKDLKTFLYENHTDYPVFEADSKVYVVDEEFLAYDNDEESSMVMI